MCWCEDYGVVVVFWVEFEIEWCVGCGFIEVCVGVFFEEGWVRCCFDIFEGIFEVVIMDVFGNIVSFEVCEYGFKLVDDGSFFVVLCFL